MFGSEVGYFGELLRCRFYTLCKCKQLRSNFDLSFVYLFSSFSFVADGVTSLRMRTHAGAYAHKHTHTHTLEIGISCLEIVRIWPI